MAARNSKSELKCFYKNLIARGKEKMVALTALLLLSLIPDYVIFMLKI